MFRDGDQVMLQSRNGRELGRYFPELLDALRAEVATRGVLDGEIVVPRRVDGHTRLDWESLSQRIHPAASRVKLLAEQTQVTADPEVATRWLTTLKGAGLDGVVAKRLDGRYLPGKRDMAKVKHHRDADCVAMGYRIHKSGRGVGSILLGLYRDPASCTFDQLDVPLTHDLSDVLES